MESSTLVVKSSSTKPRCPRKLACQTENQFLLWQLTSAILAIQFWFHLKYYSLIIKEIDILWNDVVLTDMADLVKCNERFWMNSYDIQTGTITKEELCKKSQKHRSDLFVLKSEICTLYLKPNTRNTTIYSSNSKYMKENLTTNNWLNSQYFSGSASQWLGTYHNFWWLFLSWWGWECIISM